jgi:hypothetical protein
MKYFLRGTSTKNCSRAHFLSADDKAKFEAFVIACRAAYKEDF